MQSSAIPLIVHPLINCVGRLVLVQIAVRSAGTWVCLGCSFGKRNQPGTTHKSVKETMEIFPFPLLTIFFLHFLVLTSPQSVFTVILCKGCSWPVFPTFPVVSLPVPPKFEATFEAPNQIYALDKTFPLRVCGRWGFCLEGWLCVNFWPDEYKMAR